MKKLLKTLALVAVFGVVFYAVGALAQQNQESSGGLGDVVDRLGDVFVSVKSVFYVLAAFGLIGLAAAALLGKVQWKWLFALVFGVAIVAAAGYIVDFASNTQDGGDGSIQDYTEDSAFGTESGSNY